MEMKMMNRKVEIEMQQNAFVGLNKRTFPRYEVRGFLQPEGSGWTGVALKQSMAPFSGGSETETSLTKTEALAIASEWFKISDESARKLVFG
jgi:hypothetical protein